MMRIWDVNPGYLNDKSLLGEHRELHGIVSIIRHNKKGYSSHPETMRWRGFGWALRQRHRLLREEMSLRGFKDQTPVRLRTGQGRWPDVFIDKPNRQFELLKEKYRDKVAGRIALPGNTQTLWAQHKYSVLARDPVLYRKLGNRLAGQKGRAGFAELALELALCLRKPPPARRIHNVLQHMWGYVANYSVTTGAELNSLSDRQLLTAIQALSYRFRIKYLLASTALAELGGWLD